MRINSAGTAAAPTAEAIAIASSLELGPAVRFVYVVLVQTGRVSSTASKSPLVGVGAMTQLCGVWAQRGQREKLVESYC